jgi:cell division transport system permease protein
VIGSRLRYFLSDAWDEFRHSPGVNLLAAATLAAALLVAASLALVLRNLESQLDRWRSDARVDVYLRDDVTPDHVEALREALSGLPGVQRLAYVGKAEALARFRESFGDLAELAGELQTNPLPASLEVYVDPGPGTVSFARGVAGAAAGRPGVEEVRFDREWLDRVQGGLAGARTAGAGVALLVFGAVAFVMAAVLRLAVLARRDEIEIMTLVGATPGFVRGPFLVAGLVQGLAASAVALTLLEAGRRALLASGGASALPLLRVLAGAGLDLRTGVLLTATGTAVALIGAFFAVRGT